VTGATAMTAMRQGTTRVRKPTTSASAEGVDDAHGAALAMDHGIRAHARHGVSFCIAEIVDDLVRELEEEEEDARGGNGPDCDPVRERASGRGKRIGEAREHEAGRRRGVLPEVELLDAHAPGEQRPVVGQTEGVECDAERGDDRPRHGDDDEGQEERREAERAQRGSVASDEVGAHDLVCAILRDVDDAIEQVHEEPVERAHGGEPPRIAPREEPAESEGAERGDGDDVEPAHAGEDAEVGSRRGGCNYGHAPRTLPSAATSRTTEPRRAGTRFGLPRARVRWQMGRRCAPPSADSPGT